MQMSPESLQPETVSEGNYSINDENIRTFLLWKRRRKYKAKKQWTTYLFIPTKKKARKKKLHDILTPEATQPLDLLPEITLITE